MCIRDRSYPSDGIVLIVLGGDYLIKFKPNHTVDLVVESGGGVTMCQQLVALAGPLPDGSKAGDVIECAVASDGVLTPVRARNEKRRGNSLQSQRDVLAAAMMCIANVPELVTHVWGGGATAPG